MKNVSIWKDTVRKKTFSTLSHNCDVDVLIIGGGITGVSTFYHLMNSNLKVMLVEQNKIASSVTGNSTGKLSYLQNDLIDKIRSSFNDDIAYQYIQSQKEAIHMVVDIIKKEKIHCDLEEVNSYIYTNQNQEIEKLKNLESFYVQHHMSVVYKSVPLLQSKYSFGVSDTYLFHPIKFIYGLLKNCNNFIYENTSITKIEKNDDDYLCYSKDYVIKAKWVVIASHYPYFNLPFLFPVKASLEKSYLSASLYKEHNVSIISYSNPFISIRNYKDYLIYLSNSHDVTTDVDDGKHFRELLKKVSDLKLNPDYLWSNIDVMTNDGLPYIGELHDKLLIGTGYNAWGLANGVLAGKILSDIILDKNNQYIDLFSPKRINMSQISEGIVDGIDGRTDVDIQLIKKEEEDGYFTSN